MFVGVLAGAALILMGVHWGRLSGWGSKPIDIEHLPQAAYQYEIDINRATWVEWAQFNGVGETLAKRIVADREANGDFDSVEDLLRVKGIGRQKFTGMRRHLRVEYAAKPLESAESERVDRRGNPGMEPDVEEENEGEMNEVP